MPSTQVFPQSGGITLCSGNIFSGTIFPIGGIQLLLDANAPGPIGIGLPPFPFMSGLVSGTSVTYGSGGSLSSGGLADAVSISIGKDFFVPKTRLTSGILSITISVPAASSGGRLYWESM